MFVHDKWYENNLCKVTLTGAWKTLLLYSRTPVKLTLKGNKKQFELVGIRVIIQGSTVLAEQNRNLTNRNGKQVLLPFATTTNKHCMYIKAYFQQLLK